MRSVVTTVGELVGIGAVTFGLYQMFVPAAWVFFGATLFFIAFWNGRNK